MHKRLMGLAICIMAFAVSAAAQTTVTSSGTTATTGNVPYVSAATTTSTTIQPSPISVSGGNVGIGTTTPYTPLDVKGAAAAPASSGSVSTAIFQVDDGPSSNGLGIGYYNTSPFAVWLQANEIGVFNNTAPMVLNPNGGNVGIGTTNPQAPLNIAGTQFQMFDPSQAQANFSYIKTSAFTFNTQKMTLGTTYGYSSPVDALTIFDGNVGIGTTSPGAKLEVDGNVKLTAGSGASITFQDGTVQSTAYTGVICGGDYAESVDVSGSRTNYGPGDVLVLDTENPGKILKSVEAYSTSVSGIYSTKPGTVGRRQTTAKNADEVPMAMMGIVPAKVSAENGPVKVGDLLVSSSTPGYAMKGTDHNRMLGAVIGKAMGKLDSGTGVIEVLVTLQ